jgi:hypothetical protein
MAKSEEKPNYVFVVGSVEFEPEEKEVGDKDVINVTIKSSATQKLIRATIWPNLIEKGRELEKGDIVAFGGKATTNTVDGDDGPRTYNNLSVNSMDVLGKLDRGDEDAEEEKTSSKSKSKAKAKTKIADDEPLPF